MSEYEVESTENVPPAEAHTAGRGPAADVAEDDVAVDDAVADGPAVESPVVESPVAGALAELDTLAERELADHPEVFERVHGQLHAALSAIDDA